MRAISRSVLVAAIFIGVPIVVSAQAWKADIGVNGGFSWYSESLDDEVAGPEGARFKAGWLLGSQVTFWPSSKFGLRANMTYSYRPMVSDGDIPALEDNVLHGSMNLWSGSGDLLIRLRQPNESWLGRETLPYIALGLGGKWVNPAGDFYTCVDNEEGKEWDCAPIFPTTGPLAVGEQKVLMGLVGLGADFRLSPSSALRLEINNRMYKPQVYNGAAANAANQIVLPQGDALVSQLTHEVGAQLGFHFLMGLARPPQIVVTPPPVQPPPPPAQPAPAPREDAITVCVVDLSATGGLRMQAATFRHAQGDTVITVGGEVRPLRTSVGQVMVARNAGWLVRGEPLEMTVNREVVRFTPYQTAQYIEASRLVYLGNVNGFPVYADRDEVADVITPLNTARAGRTDADLGTLLAGHTAARNTVTGVSYLYVPLDPYGCVFQPVQRLEDVRKGGK
jgi:hypothetical protein